MSTDLFRIYLSTAQAAVMGRDAVRGMWEAAVIEQGRKPAPGGVTVHRFGNRVTVVGRVQADDHPA